MRTVVYGVPDFEVIRWTLTNIVIFGSVDARNFFFGAQPVCGGVSAWCCDKLR